MEVFITQNGDKAYLKDVELLKTDKVEYAKHHDVLQTSVFNFLRELGGKKTDVPNYDGWVPWMVVYEWCCQGENYGQHPQSLFYSTILHTYGWRNPSHATYMVKAFTYQSSQENQGSQDTYVLIKMRPRPDKPSGGGWGSSTKRQRQGWTSYGE